VRQATLHCIRFKHTNALAAYARLVVKKSHLISPMATKILDLTWFSNSNAQIGSLLAPMIVQWHPALVSLELVCPTDLKDIEELVEALAQLHHLRVLVFSMWSMTNALQWYHVQRILDTCSLHHLEVRDAVQPHSAFLAEQCYPTLLSLTLEQRVLTAHALLGILTACPMLRCLRLFYVPSPGPSGWADACAHSLRDVRSLDVISFEDPTEEAEAAGMETLEQLLPKLKHLEHLSLPRVRFGLADGLLWSIAAPLRTLTMSLRDGLVTWAGVIAWMAKQERLRRASKIHATVRLRSAWDAWYLPLADQDKVEVREVRRPRAS
jgi:hypothetical protein